MSSSSDAVKHGSHTEFPFIESYGPFTVSHQDPLPSHRQRNYLCSELTNCKGLHNHCLSPQVAKLQQPSGGGGCTDKALFFPCSATALLTISSLWRNKGPINLQDRQDSKQCERSAIGGTSSKHTTEWF